MTYQDIYINGETRSKGERECASRYEAIREVLSAYRRPFSVLDIGAAQGYFSFRILEDFPEATVVAIDEGKQLLELCDESGSDLIHLQRRISADELSEMAKCEQFDVVLALNVLHHFGGGWRKAFHGIRNLGHTVIIETPPPEDTGACGQGVVSGIWEVMQGAAQIASTPSHTSPVERPMYRVHGAAPAITKSYIDAPPVAVLGRVGLHMTLDEARVTFHRKGVVRDWIPGLNLRTWQRLGGVWPRAGEIALDAAGAYRRALLASGDPEGEHLDGSLHGDLNPWNVIMTRNGCHLIDGKGEDPGRAIYEDDIEKLIQEVCGC